MFVTKRQQLMFSYIKEKVVVSINEVADTFKVSVVTARKDIEILEKQTANIKKVHGGVIWKEEDIEEKQVQHDSLTYLNERFSERVKLNPTKKKALANKAITLIQDGESILLDAGSTIYEFAKTIPNNKKLTVLITALNIAEVLETNHAVTKIILGGVFRSKSTTMVSSMMEQTISSVHVDKLFIAASGLSLSHGFTCNDILETDVKKGLLASAKEVYWLLDSSKIGKISSFQISPLKRNHSLIVDSGIQMEDKRKLEKELNVIIAD
ncbi:DeoR/GlpR family DNA-binding transcription regulator [Oceanobacillus polygoni]|uniref:DeoR/GlpR family transcriptional regulator of sugar metabolism n=1 Tax=Oceanobacillus polygoni TaxID=1235259 RepID=A0A9X0YRE4_9BACI|nr:DeoR/GlpR family DNA-binding transcription regulator [Oceanobacillus polygoni]MBP2075980.1 DeoR/GlpR family transcriptional regulator of sugar metabolism [Oceanobacillus polygoni]